MGHGLPFESRRVFVDRRGCAAAGARTLPPDPSRGGTP